MSVDYMNRFEVDAAFDEVFNTLSVIPGSIYSRRWHCGVKQEWGLIAVRRTTFWMEHSLTIMVESIKQGVLMEVISMLTFKYGFVHRRNIKNVARYLQKQGFKVNEVNYDK